MNRVAVDVFVSRPLSSFGPDLPVVPVASNFTAVPPLPVRPFRVH